MDLLLLSDLAQSSEQLLRRALADPGPLTVALVFGGGLDEETAQKIGEAQRGFYPKPPGL